MSGFRRRLVAGVGDVLRGYGSTSVSRGSLKKCFVSDFGIDSKLL